jgi:hypothetical protein
MRVADLENISQGTDEDLAIQASIQASLKELLGDNAPPEVAQEPALEEESIPNAIQESIEKLPQEPEFGKVPEDSMQDSTVESTEDSDGESISTEDSVQETFFDSATEGTEDILFEEVLDIDAIQQKLLERIYEDDPSVESSQDVDTVIDKEVSIIEEKRAKLPVKYNSITSKKYVIYVDSENIDFMENLTIEERKEVINKILKEQNVVSVKTKEFNHRAKIIKHALIAVFTFIIGFPVMFIVVNKSIESSFNNVQEAKQNVARLYKQNGKIKMSQQQ